MKFTQNKYFQSKKRKKKKKIEHLHLTQHIQIILGTKFHLSSVFSDQICPNVAVLVRNRKNEHHHRVQLIQINLDTKFHLKNRQF